MTLTLIGFYEKSNWLCKKQGNHKTIIQIKKLRALSIIFDENEELVNDFVFSFRKVDELLRKA